jgi:D-arabinose 1-dehydrogenase-like Zn-dependent alcohol dehydrogenase
VVIQILQCGVCHSDIHSVRNDWGGAKFPLVPGHEIIGKVLSVGNGVTRAYERMIKSDVKYRFVIDMASLKG